MGAALSRPPFFRESCRNRKPLLAAGWVGETRGRKACSRANGLDAKLHGQGPRAEARAARGAPHLRRANARRVTPCGFDVPSRLGRRAGAGPCQLLRRVRPLSPRSHKSRDRDSRFLVSKVVQERPNRVLGQTSRQARSAFHLDNWKGECLA